VGQVTVQAPFELAPARIPVVVRTGLGTPDALETLIADVEILPAFPGVFEEAGAAAAMRADGTRITRTSPARRGETLRILATGLGPVLPAATTNVAGVGGQRPFFQPVVTLGGREVAGVTAEYAKNLLGVFVVMAPVPADAPSGEVPLVLRMVDGARVYSGAPSRIPIE
jgi:uncharacterized protein (TIGR03437 family)